MWPCSLFKKIARTNWSPDSAPLRGLAAAGCGLVSGVAAWLSVNMLETAKSDQTEPTKSLDMLFGLGILGFALFTAVLGTSLGATVLCPVDPARRAVVGSDSDDDEKQELTSNTKLSNS
jgi:hypothetical protein